MSSIETQDELHKRVKAAFLQEFHRTFREIHSPPADSNQLSEDVTEYAGFVLPKEKQKAQVYIQNLLLDGKDKLIADKSQKIRKVFGGDMLIENAIYSAAVNCAMAGNFEDRDELNEAIKFWEELKDEAQNKHQIIYNIGNALLALKNINEAITHYEKAINIFGEFPQCWKNMGDAYYNKGEIDKAIDCYETALKFEPNLFQALYSLGTTHYNDKEDSKTALKYFEKIQDAQNLPQQWLAALSIWKAKAYSDIGDFSKAVSEINEAIYINDQPTWVWETGAQVYSRAVKADREIVPKALDFWPQYIEKNEYDAQALKEYGYLLWSQVIQEGDESCASKAIEKLEKSLELGEIDKGLIFDRLGHLYDKIERRDDTKAEEYFQKAFEENSDNFGFCYGQFLVNSGKFKDALPLVEKAAKEVMKDDMSWFQYAVCKEKLGEFEEAKNAYEKALEINPDYPQAKFNLGGLYWNNGYEEQAKKEWKQACEQFPKHPLVAQVESILGEGEING
jgi:tetratricopeptide (TPR) repeat protein